MHILSLLMLASMSLQLLGMEGNDARNAQARIQKAQRYGLVTQLIHSANIQLDFATDGFEATDQYGRDVLALAVLGNHSQLTKELLILGIGNVYNAYYCRTPIEQLHAWWQWTWDSDFRLAYDSIQQMLEEKLGFEPAKPQQRCYVRGDIGMMYQEQRTHKD
jgi:hypothetical protein